MSVSNWRITLLATTLALLPLNPHANDSINIETVSIKSFFGDKISVTATKGEYCKNAGVSITMTDEHVIDYVSLRCLNNNQIDELIEGLKKAKIKSEQLKSLNL